ncbi:hypothetical protein HAX54_038284 [Datura stramonium]|uniref:Uncharacterized protein n=1 Tax=Datura stramonium TaxID=4076 RepID=A0ABS8SHT1_DATST|nr:hypothetical protein [Datura stramonium]
MNSQPQSSIESSSDQGEGRHYEPNNDSLYLTMAHCLGHWDYPVIHVARNPQEEPYNGPLYLITGHCVMAPKSTKKLEEVAEKREIPRSDSFEMSQNLKALVVPRRAMRSTPRMNLQL